LRTDLPDCRFTESNQPLGSARIANRRDDLPAVTPLMPQTFGNPGAAALIRIALNGVCSSQPKNASPTFS